MNTKLYSSQFNFVDTHFGLKDLHLQNTLLIGFGIALLAIASQIAIPVPFSPVPITAQSLMVLIIGSLFGAKRALYTTLGYLALGSMGAPIFSAGSFGLAKVFGPTGGYLLGFAIAAYLMGKLAELKKDRTIKDAIALFTLGHVVIFAVGLTWLSFYVGANNTLAMGLYPFIPGLIIKTFLAALIVPGMWKSKES